MRGNGTIMVKSISNFFKKLFSVILRRRSHQALNPHFQKVMNTYERMEITRKGQDNMIEFVKIVPDECLIELSEKIYCVRK